jgi:hypothetical protein
MCDSNRGSDGELAVCRPHLEDAAGHLVTHRDREPEGKGLGGGCVLEQLPVGAAHRGRSDIDSDLAEAKIRLGPVGHIVDSGGVGRTSPRRARGRRFQSLRGFLVALRWDSSAARQGRSSVEAGGQTGATPTVMPPQT